MQASLSARSAGCTRPCSSPRMSRSVVVRASVEDSRRAVLSGFIGGVALSLAASAQAVTPVDLFDDRKVKATGFENIYEARDASLPQSVREGLSQARADLASTKSRVKESEVRIDSDLEPAISKAYWTEAREQLRRQLYTLRFDLQTLASSKPKEEKKKVLALRKDFIAKVEDLDFALRSKDKESSLKKLSSTKSALDAVLAVAL